MKFWRLTLSLAFAICCFCAQQLNAQEYQLQLEKASSGKIKQFDLDDKLFYRLKGEKETKKGLLTGVETGAFYIDGDRIALDEVLFIGKERPARILLILLGVPIVVVGVIWMALGGLFFTVGSLTLHATFIVGGFMDLNAGAIVTLAGALPLLFRGKQFKVTTGFWELQAVPSALKAN